MQQRQFAFARPFAEIALLFMPDSQMPRLAFCLEYPILDFGGTEVLVAELVRGLSARFQIVLVSPDQDLSATEFAPLLSGHICWKMGDSGEALVAALWAAHVLLVHFHCGGNYAWRVHRTPASPIWQAQQKGLRCLTTNHGFFSPWEGYSSPHRPFWLKLALWPRAWIAKMLILVRLECEVAVSQYDERELRRWYWPLRNRFRQIYHSQLREEDLMSAASPRISRIVCVGTFGSRKGQPVLAKAFGRLASQHPGWSLLFVGRIGEMETWEATQRQIELLGLEERVTRLEGASHTMVAELLRESEIFVMPSLFEGLGLSLQEALFYGCACVATRCGGPEDLIADDENGLLVEKNNPGALATALQRLMSDSSLRHRFRQRGPASVLEKGMTAPTMVKAYDDLYRELLPA